MTTELEPDVRRFLEAPGRFGVLATVNPDGSPHQAVIWFLVKRDGLRINSLEGRRWPSNLLRDSRCSLTVEAGMDYVAVRGDALPVGDAEEAQADIAEMARRYRSPQDAEAMIERRFRPQRRVSFHLRPRAVTVHWDAP